MSRRAVSAAPRGDMSSEIHPWPGWKDASSQLTSQCEAKFGAPRPQRTPVPQCRLPPATHAHTHAHTHTHTGRPAHVSGSLRAGTQTDQGSILSLVAAHVANHEWLHVVVRRCEATHAVVPDPIVVPHKSRRVMPIGERVQYLLAVRYSTAPIAFCHRE